MIFNVTFPLMTLPLLTHSLGVDGYGQYAKVLSFAMLYVVLGELGMDMALTRRIGNDASSHLHKGLLHVFIKLRLVQSLFFLLPLALIGLVIFEFSIVEAIFFITVGFFTSLNFGFYFHGVLQASRLFYLSLICKLIVLISYFVAWYFNFEIVGFFIIGGISALLLSVLPGFYVWYRLRNVTAKYVDVKSILTDSMQFYGSRLVVNAYLSGSTFLFSFFVSDTNVGFYSLALQIYRIGASLIGGLAKTLLVSISFSSVYSNLLKIVVLLSIFALVLAPVVWFVGEWAIPLVFGEGFNGVILYVMLFYIGLVFQISGAVFGYPYFNAVGRIELAHKSIFFSSLVYVALISLILLSGNDNLFLFIIPIVVVDILVSLSRMILSVKVSREQV